MQKKIDDRPQVIKVEYRINFEHFQSPLNNAGIYQKIILSRETNRCLFYPKYKVFNITCVHTIIFILSIFMFIPE